MKLARQEFENIMSSYRNQMEHHTAAKQNAQYKQAIPQYTPTDDAKPQQFSISVLHTMGY
jgi:hypothetical protein